MGIGQRQTNHQAQQLFALLALNLEKKKLEHMINLIDKRVEDGHILSDQRQLMEHMEDFVQNKVRLGKILQFTNSSIPIHSPREGILNMQFSIQNPHSDQLSPDFFEFVVRKVQAVECYERWLLVDNQPASTCLSLWDLLWPAEPIAAKFDQVKGLDKNRLEFTANLDSKKIRLLRQSMYDSVNQSWFIVFKQLQSESKGSFLPCCKSKKGASKSKPVPWMGYIALTQFMNKVIVRVHIDYEQLKADRHQQTFSLQFCKSFSSFQTYIEQEYIM